MNASSIESPSTSGDVSLKILNTALLAAVYASNRGLTKMSPGQSFLAVHPPIPPVTPNAFASYDAAVTTPPPTAIGLPSSRGLSRCSTDAKNESRSA